MRSSTIAAAVLIALTGSADAYVFNQCANLLITTNLLTGLINAVLTLLSPANSYTGCPNYCSTQQNAKWSLYQPGLAGLLGTCYCTNLDPGGAFAMSGTNAAGSCGTGSYQINYLPSDPWTLSGCQNNPTLTGGPASFSTSQAEACYTSCASYAFAALTPRPLGTFDCQCGMALRPGTSATCNDNVATVYRSNTIAPSGVARKRMLAARAEAERATLGDCPRGLDACTIPGSEYAYECLDTNAELEACGGCVNGYFNVDQNLNGTVGTDCATIHGVALGGASCVRGRCEVSRCRKGYRLEDGHCVRTFRFDY